jgi:uncharacterized membrane protein YeaQ/YmgE (transglycosylase-associated protein family)
MIGHAVVELVTGICAKLLVPAPDPGSLIISAIAGMVGCWLAAAGPIAGL